MLGTQHFLLRKVAGKALRLLHQAHYQIFDGHYMYQIYAVLIFLLPRNSKTRDPCLYQHMCTTPPPNAREQVIFPFLNHPRSEETSIAKLAHVKRRQREEPGVVQA